MEQLALKYQLLVEALPYIRRFKGAKFVIKLGGEVISSPEALEQISQDVALLKLVGMNPLLVHGGGDQISELMQKLGMQPKFVDGLRVTDPATIQAVEMAFSQIRSQLVIKLQGSGVHALGISGIDSELIKARKKSGAIDLGLVGEPITINTQLLNQLLELGYVPVITPLGIDDQGNKLNINADEAAAKIASELKANKLIIITDVPGILRDLEDPSSLIPEISLAQLKRMLAQGYILKGMIPKVKACISALESGVERAHIVGYQIPHAILLEIFTDKGVGSMIYS